MARAVHTLQVAGPPGAVFRVTDGASRCVATGMHRLDLQLPRGLYTVSALMGSSMESREVLLDAPQSIDLQTSQQSFGDQAFALAPQVLAAIGDRGIRPGGAFIALRGPWRDEEAAADRISLDRDGLAVLARRDGFVPDPQGRGVWSWQLFDLATPAATASAAAPGVLSVTRSVCDSAEPPPRGAPASGLAPPASPSGHTTSTTDAAEPGPPPNVCHVLPHWGDWMVWAAYPATPRGTPDPLQLPPAHYVRLRLALPGAAPPVALQSLHDQVFTALGARTGLPLTSPVLDLLLSDGADPLLAVAAAHVGSITLGTIGRQSPLPHDASSSVRAAGSSTDDALTGLQLIDADALQQRLHGWLAQHGTGPLATSPDIVAARFLFGLTTPAHLRVPPVLLRSLDGLISAVESPDARAAGTRCDDSVWGARLQISDAFAFLQWNPDIDYAQELMSSVKRSLESVQESVRFIEQAKSQAAEQKVAEQAPLATASAPRKTAGSASVRRGTLSSAFPTPLDPIIRTRAELDASALDIDAFIKNNVKSLRIPASAMMHFGTVLSNLSIDQNAVANTLQQMKGRLKE